MARLSGKVPTTPADLEQLMNKSDDLDQLLDTFSKDREFCDSFASKYPFETARLLAYVRWAQLYFTEIQDELHEMASKHFPQAHLKQARFWTLALTGGVRKDISLVPYFNRPDPEQKDLSTDLEILGNGVEMMCVETTGVHGEFGKQYGVTPSPGGQGGYYLTLLKNRGADSEMSQLQQQILTQLGWLKVE